MRLHLTWVSVRSAASRLGRWGMAHVAVRIEEYAFDFVLYPFMLYRGGEMLLSGMCSLLGCRLETPATGGYWLGLAVLTAASVAINLAYVRAYDRLKTDWFGFEALKEAVERLPAILRQEPWRRAARYCTFGYLSLWHSPLFATLFMRREPGAYAMTRTDWRAFWAAIVVANIGWAGLVSGVVEGGKLVVGLLG